MMGLNAFLIFSLNQKSKFNPDEIEQVKSMYHLLFNNTFIQLKSENHILRNVQGNINDNDNISLKPLLSDNVKLIFRFSEYHCSMCIENALMPLVKYSKIIGVENIIILASYKNARTLNIFIKKNAPGIKVFNTKEKLDIPMEEWDTPYFFIADNTMKAQLIFIPVKEIVGYTEEYLKIINQRYYNKNEFSNNLNE
jgi:hypothetical protein